MLVEDDNNLREIYEARLLAEGYEIVSAQDGEEALTLAVKEKPDLIIADVMMPKISGFDMLDILRSTPQTKDTKVIMMTALSQSQEQERAKKLGADRYLIKSQVTLEDVARVAKEVLEGKPEAASDKAATDNAVQETVEPTTAAETTAEPAADVATPTTVTPPIVEPITDSTAPTTEPVTNAVVQPITTATPAEPAVATNDAAATDQAQTTAAEEATVDKQIKEFEDKVVPEPQTTAEPTTTPPIVEPVAPSEVTKVPVVDAAPDVEPKPEEPVVDSTSQVAQNASNIAAAANEVLDNTDEKTEDTPANAINPSKAGNRVIQPPTASATPPTDINELLKQEEAKEAAANSQPDEPQPNQETPPAPTPQLAAEDTPTLPAEPPIPSSGVDPNNIAL